MSKGRITTLEQCEEHASLWQRRSCDPLDIQRLAFPGDLWFVLVNPVFEAPTAEMRAVLPRQVPMASAIRNCAMGGSLVRLEVAAMCT
jgi:homoserine kinase